VSAGSALIFSCHFIGRLAPFFEALNAAWLERIMTRTSRWRAINPLEWPKIIYETIGAKHPVLSLIAASLLGAFLFGGGWWLIGEQYKRDAEKLHVTPSPVVTPAPSSTGSATANGPGSVANSGTIGTLNQKSEPNGDQKK